MDKAEARKLIDELNDLSSNFEKNKERMVEIAKILLTDHYGYLPRNKKSQGPKKYCLQCSKIINKEQQEIWRAKHKH